MNSHKIIQRHDAILALVRQHGTISVNALAVALGVSEETIRRDSRPLADRSEISKGHGALSLPHYLGEAPFERRMRENAVAKRAIAQAAIDLVEDGDSLIIDAGTTTSVFARELRTRRHLTVVTNSSDIARTLATVNGNTVYMAGGELFGDSGAAFGPAAIEFVGRFKVRHTFISISAIDTETGPMDQTLVEAEFARVALSCAQNRVLLTDASKFGHTALVQVCAFSDLTALVTDSPPGQNLASALAKANVTVTVA